ncbi:hypothetical protein [Psychrobacter fjordensis]|uniref:hypothetical protein n=1 Tax=Psychrobacter fjordensis TaxID=664424 RepID=UPI00191B2E26|nr:hypothetical protein [Psychrobacter fjordensis]
MIHYREVIIETYENIKGGSSKRIRARPIEGQGLDTNMNVECSLKMRKPHPVGTKFLLQAKVTEKEGGKPFLYAHYDARYTLIKGD